MVTGRRWRFILNLIDHLPSNSNYLAAIADDDELADQQSGEAAPRPPRLTEWSPEVQGIAVLADRVGELIRVMIAQGGRRPPKIPHYPRPVTASERAKQRRKLATHRELVARVLPHKRDEPTDQSDRMFER